MSVMRFDPFGDPFRQVDRLTSQLLSGTRTPMGMPMDVWQGDDGYHVALDLPGVDPSTVDITCERNMLTIRAERRAEYGDAQNVVIAERPQGTFTRQLQVGDVLDTSKVQATYDNGVLLLTIPIAEAAQPRRIQVQHGQGAQQGGQQIDITGAEQSQQASSQSSQSGQSGQSSQSGQSG